jgi:hypothetical protein
LKLYLHAGTHKTGTTALQAFAAANRKYLKKRGLLYSDYAPLKLKKQDAHHWIAHALAETVDIPMNIDSVKYIVNKWYKKAKLSHKNVLISVEALYRHVLGTGSYSEKRNSYLKRVAEMFRNFDTTIILVFRRPDNYLRSLYQERVMRGIRPLPTFENFLSKPQQGLDYYYNSIIFQEVFSEVKCLIYEDLNRSGNFCTDFFKELEVDVSHLPEVGVVRKSLSPQETQLKNFANAYVDNSKSSKLFLKWMRTPDIKQRVSAAFGNSAYSLWPSHEVRKQFLESRENDLKNLQETFFPGRTALFPTLKEADTLPPVPPLPDNLKKMIFDYFGRTS